MGTRPYTVTPQAELDQNLGVPTIAVIKGAFGLDDAGAERLQADIRKTLLAQRKRRVAALLRGLRRQYGPRKAAKK